MQTYLLPKDFQAQYPNHRPEIVCRPGKKGYEAHAKRESARQLGCSFPSTVTSKGRTETGLPEILSTGQQGKQISNKNWIIKAEEFCSIPSDQAFKSTTNLLWVKSGARKCEVASHQTSRSYIHQTHRPPCRLKPFRGKPLAKGGRLRKRC